eukprot:753924-Hanusia_phi.AAC.1
MSTDSCLDSLDVDTIQLGPLKLDLKFTATSFSRTCSTALLFSWCSFFLFGAVSYTHLRAHETVLDL